MAQSKKAAFRAMYELNDEQEMFRETIADYVKDKMIPRREELDQDKKFPQWFYDDMVEMGITSLIIPEDCDGLGFGLFDVALVIEEIAVGCSGAATSLGATFLGTDPILYFGTEEQKKKYLPRVAAGEVAAFSLTEPDAGSDAGGISTVADRQEDGSYTLRGQKTYVTNGGVATIYTTFALTDKTRGARGITGFIFEVDPKNPTPGIEFPKKFDKMGINASETREIIFDGFPVAKDDVIGGKEGRGFLHSMGTFDATRPMIGIIGVGIARSAYEEALKYAHERSQFGKPIISFRGLQEMFVDMTTTVEATRALCLEVAQKVDAKMKGRSREDVTLLSGVAKVVGSEAGRITLDALQTTGGYGYMNETPFPKFVRDFKIFEIFEGTNQIQREQISLQLIKEQAKGTRSATALQEAEEAIGLSPDSGMDSAIRARKALDACIAYAVENAHPSDQYLRFLLADMLIDIETAHTYCKAVSRLGETDRFETNTMTARIFAKEAALRTGARARRFLIATGGEDALEKIAPTAGLADLEYSAAGLAEDRKALATILAAPQD